MFKSSKFRTFYFLVIGIFSVAVVFLTNTIKIQKNEYDEKLKNQEIEHNENLYRLGQEMAWFKWYHSEYAATLRQIQYGLATGNTNHLMVKNEKDFIPIESVTSSIVCPVASNGPFSNDYIYFGARMMPLESQDDFNFYAISYLGSAAFAHSEKAFDALIGKEQFDQRMVSLELPHGLINSWLERNSYKDLRFGEDFD